MITRKFVESLGWKFDDFWNNRAMFSLGINSPFALFEHNGDWGIMDPQAKEFALIYCDMTSKMVETFTKLAKAIDEIVDNPKSHTLYEYIEAQAKMLKFVKQMKDRS